MAIHRIEADKNFIIYTGDEGAKQIEDAFIEGLKEESERLKELVRRKELFKKIEEDKQKRRDLMASFIKSLKK